MSEILNKIAACVERGKIDAKSPYPPDMAGENGADELTREALDSGIAARSILAEALIIGMHNIGEKFRRNEVFLPDVLMSAKAMTAAMTHLRPYFLSGEVTH